MITEKPYSLLILLLFLDACASTSTNVPAWITEKQASGYPRDQYIIGVGMAPLTREEAEDVKQADALARSNIAKQLQVKVEDLFLAEVESRTEYRGGRQSKEATRQTFSQRSKEQVDLTLEGVEIVHRHYDENRKLHYAMAVLPKRTAATRLSENARTGFADAEKMTYQSKQALREGDITRALKNYVSAADAYERADMDQRIARILKPGLPDYRLDANPRASLEKLAGKIRIRCVSGCSQEARINASLPEPIEIQVTLTDGTPVRNLPLFVRWPGRNEPLEMHEKTDESGRAAIKIDNVERTGEAVNRVRIAVQWDKVFQTSADKTSSPGPARIQDMEIVTKYTLRTTDRTRVLVRTCVLANDRPMQDRVVMPEILENLKTVGFIVTGTDGGCRGSATDPDGMGGDIVVTVDASTNYAGRRANIVMYKSHLRLTAHDLDTDDTIASIEGEATGGASDRSLAADRSLRQGIRDLAGPFVEQMRTMLR